MNFTCTTVKFHNRVHATLQPLWPIDPKFSAFKDLNHLKKYIKYQVRILGGFEWNFLKTAIVATDPKFSAFKDLNLFKKVQQNFKGGFCPLKVTSFT